MSLAEPQSYESVPNVMTARRLIHALSTWLEDQHPSDPKSDPKRLYWVSQQAIDELGGRRHPRVPPQTGQEELVPHGTSIRKRDPRTTPEGMDDPTGTGTHRTSPRHGRPVR